MNNSWWKRLRLLDFSFFGKQWETFQKVKGNLDVTQLWFFFSSKLWWSCRSKKNWIASKKKKNLLLSFVNKKLMKTHLVGSYYLQKKSSLFLIPFKTAYFTFLVSIRRSSVVSGMSWAKMCNLIRNDCDAASVLMRGPFMFRSTHVSLLCSRL